MAQVPYSYLAPGHWPIRRGKRRGAADRAAVRVDGLRVYACLAAGAFQYTVSTCTTKLHAGSMRTGSTSIACVPIGASTRRLHSTCMSSLREFERMHAQQQETPRHFSAR